MSARGAWTKPYYGITHLGEYRDERRVTVVDYGGFARLPRYIRGHGRLSESIHASVEEAKPVGARWIAELTAWLEARRANLKNPEENRARHETDGTNRPITFRPTSEGAQHG